MKFETMKRWLVAGFALGGTALATTGEAQAAKLPAGSVKDRVMAVRLKMQEAESAVQANPDSSKGEVLSAVWCNYWNNWGNWGNWNNWSNWRNCWMNY